MRTASIKPYASVAVQTAPTQTLSRLERMEVEIKTETSGGGDRDNARTVDVLQLRSTVNR